MSYRHVPADDVLLEELAAELGLRPRTLYAWRYAGRGPHSFKFLGRVRYRRADIEAWIAQERGEAVTDAAAAG